MSFTESQDYYCSELAKQNREPLFGTASTAKSWLLLEYTQPWQAKAVTDNNLPESVQQWLKSQLEMIDNGRLLFIKQQRRKVRDFAFYLVQATETAQHIFRFTLEKYEDLLALDFRDSVEVQYAAHRSDEQLWLVCTNGRRDRCCAKFGRPLYDMMTLQVAQNHGSQQSVWQCTDGWGHRYAATLVTFPTAVFYGYMAPSQAEVVRQHVDANELMLAHYRGRGYYPAVVQAADYFLRHRTGNLALSAYRWLEAEQTADSLWSVSFADEETGDTHLIHLEAGLTEQGQLASCSPPKYKPQPIFHFVRHEVKAAVPT